MFEQAVFFGIVALWLFVSYELNHLLKYIVVTRILKMPASQYHDAMEVPFPFWVWILIVPFSTFTTITIVWTLDILIHGF